jgi:hypothetical protein
MRGSADVAGLPEVRGGRAFFRFESVCPDQPPELKLESISDFSHPEMRAARGPFLVMRFRHIFSLAFLTSSSVAPFRSPNSDSRSAACFATSRPAREIIAPGALHSHATFLIIRRHFPSEGERCMKHIVHPVVHISVHRRIFGKARSRISCAWHDGQFGREQNTGLGWSDPTFVHVSVPKVIRGVAPAQLRGDRAESFVRAAFHSKEPQ